jgi:hypothetical protein
MVDLTTDFRTDGGISGSEAAPDFWANQTDNTYSSTFSTQRSLPQAYDADHVGAMPDMHELF